MYLVYVLMFDSDEKLYIGYTSNLKRRLIEHQNKQNTSTKNRGSFTLIYFEGYLDKFDALGRERFLKSGSGHSFLKKQLKCYLCSR